MSKLDDSGIGPDKIVIMFYTTLQNSERCTVFAGEDETLADKLTQFYPNKKIEKMLVWSKIRGLDSDRKCLNPYLITCGFIQPETDVEMEEVGEIVNGYEITKKLQDTKSYTNFQPEDKNTLFCIEINNRRKMEGITKIHYKTLRYRDMCVVASPGQSYKNAIIRDGRFVHVDRFTLKRKVEGAEGPTVDMALKPSDTKEVMTFIVKVNKAAQSSSMSSVHPSASSTLSHDEGEQSVSETHQKENFNKLSEKLWQENAFYVFSKNPSGLTKDEILSEMLKCLRARAWCTLVGPKDRGTKKYEISLQKLVQNEFANQNIGSRPVRVAKKLMDLYDSVGILECGSVIGTCFLVSDNLIATSGHVVRDILDARGMSTADDHTIGYVSFDFENAEKQKRRYTLKLGELNEDLINYGPAFDYGSTKYYGSTLDYAFLYLDECVFEVLPLGDFVRCKVPERGTVCIAGHPNGKEKLEEVCPILPLHDGRRAHQLEKRFEQNEWHCKNNQSGCALAYAGRTCVHSYQPRLEKLRDEEESLTYDVGSMFEGASGAPVFDLKCHIVALHTAGFRLGETSVVEYGITFDAIINNLEAREQSQFVREHFPYCRENRGKDCEDMDTTE